MGFLWATLSGRGCCVQEVQADHFENFLEPELAKYNYAGVHKCKTREFMGQYGKMDGCAKTNANTQTSTETNGPGRQDGRVRQSYSLTYSRLTFSHLLCRRCAILYRRDKFTIVPGGVHDVEFNSIARSRHSSDKRVLNRLLKDNVAQVLT